MNKEEKEAFEEAFKRLQMSMAKAIRDLAESTEEAIERLDKRLTELEERHGSKP